MLAFPDMRPGLLVAANLLHFEHNFHYITQVGYKCDPWLGGPAGQVTVGLVFFSPFKYLSCFTFKDSKILLRLLGYG